LTGPWCFPAIVLGVLWRDPTSCCSFPTSFLPALKFLANFLVMFIL
jgi:hypothetical protein